MTHTQNYQHDQLILNKDQPDWGYGRIVELRQTQNGEHYWVYFYFPDRFVALNANQLQEVPPN